MNEPGARAEPMVRALFRSLPAPGGQGSLYSKVYYPALYTGTQTERNTGALPPDSASGPWPVAIFMPGINVSPESYGWLANALAAAGYVAVLYGWVVEELPGLTALSPGLDVKALAPGEYASRPSATALPAVLEDLSALDSDGPLAGLLDLDSILLGGHSAGGSVALFNARPNWFAGVKAVFAYGAHSKASTLLGYPAGTVLPLPGDVPMLILGGSEDGVIAASAFRYGPDENQAPDPVGPLQQSFEQALDPGRGDRYLAIVSGANHFSPCWPADPASGRPFLDWPEQRPGEDIRQDISALICAFAQAHVRGDAQAGARLHELGASCARFAVA